MLDTLIGGIVGGIAGAIIGTVDGFARGIGICPDSYQSCTRTDCEEHKKKLPTNLSRNGGAAAVKAKENGRRRRQKDRE
ncbi:hypothetical protein AtNW77_Chr1g0068651 [Arabidopsis thaliana]|uniref:At1g67860/T23K23_29 n=4 Tax=Arabidopsis TaxID=3701 RepID=Q9C9V2_ARATH|nr:uncharacterized protein AT1G67860 [Arabidopsis thaliana]KAG7650926.1 hypothetical protein ISN45_At01g058410 [Arabidopsis thaliana x Arabidopsis arenosa]KAG7658787.1 hypothetical protein ISN44_As01g057430 [Arabidopsis suecica]AAG51999.1 unknown protein; 99214-99450 [Arabidopsis thaliana]AAL06562.1 At1g67860/T23K23_29 [Arabidopsis thaliana]AAL77733.1 At1g67860/T23K23_29 [Arabidopsis thaliana]|eukprot:NP_564910.1 transmembrane protein [Arabidopsis thaliana]